MEIYWWRKILHPRCLLSGSPEIVSKNVEPWTWSIPFLPHLVSNATQMTYFYMSWPIFFQKSNMVETSFSPGTRSNDHRSFRCSFMHRPRSWHCSGRSKFWFLQRSRIFRRYPRQNDILSFRLVASENLMHRAKSHFFRNIRWWTWIKN